MTEGSGGPNRSGPRVARAVGALIEAGPTREASIYERVRVGPAALFGEVVRIDGEAATVQVYEDTTGLALEDMVHLTGEPMTVALGPGLLGSILDGVGRPLPRLADQLGDFITAGAEAATLDATRRWPFVPVAAAGQRVQGGDVLGTVQERGILHRVLVPPEHRGVIASLAAGEYTVADPIGALADGTPLHLGHSWPMRRPRPIAERRPMDRPFITGQRVLDFLFPVAEGGTAAVPGGFGTGKTVIEQSLAKFSEADVIVYVGCGERGNEMADVLAEFPELTDPRTGGKVMDRAVLIVNTSNMPVAAREASIDLGVTIAEYYRDMGYRAALMIDSLSRWAEALREISGRMGEMPGEEGYPTSLSSRLGRFYERAGRVRTLGTPGREGAVTMITAISPPGGDFSEPVTQAALRVCGALWALDPSLAHQRHFPAVDWGTSYSLYDESIGPWFDAQVGPEWRQSRSMLSALLQRERELRDITSLVGPEALEDVDRLTMVVAGIVRDTLLRQNANHPDDATSPLEKTAALATDLRLLREVGAAALASGVAMRDLDLEPARRALTALRDAPRTEIAARDATARATIQALAPKGRAAEQRAFEQRPFEQRAPQGGPSEGSA